MACYIVCPSGTIDSIFLLASFMTQLAEACRFEDIGFLDLDYDDLGLFISIRVRI